ncbi:MAG TPA: SpoIIE family protein phosphatase [Thermoanaerobaculia bacterium]|jgi:sigma-B regulation protein RsbU (phosphoserine phosphatase)
MQGSAPSATLAQTWDELLALSRDEAGERQLLERLLDLWRREHGARAAGLYLERGETLEQEAAVGDGLPQIFEGSGAADSFGSLRFPGGRLLFAPREAVGAGEAAQATSDPLTLLLAGSLKSCRLKHDLKEQQFQVNYRVVELEALYDVGLAVASTLDLDRLSEEILLRAVSLLDARRGALYILADGRYRLDRTFGGEAAPWFDGEDPELHAFLTGGGPAPAPLLPGTRYLLGVLIEVESGPRGFIAVGDKESRRGVGPFLPSDRRTLSLFANQAALALENARLHLQALEKERLEREMQLAAEIQRQILPKGAPVVPGYQLTGWYRPARQVGGDYYDLFPLKDGRIRVVVGDVSGKGMPAALMVSTLHSALRLLFDQAQFGPSLLERLNRHIVESSAANKFITMLLAELDPQTAVLHYMNAGHNPGILLRSGSTVEQLTAGGLPLGLLPQARFQSRALTLGPGDLLCLYSDGITEAESPGEEEFGMARLTDLLLRERDRPLDELIEAVIQTVGEFSQGRPQGDDQTLVLLRRE